MDHPDCEKQSKKTTVTKKNDPKIKMSQNYPRFFFHLFFIYFNYFFYFFYKDVICDYYYAVDVFLLHLNILL